MEKASEHSAIQVLREVFQRAGQNTLDLETLLTVASTLVASGNFSLACDLYRTWLAHTTSPHAPVMWCHLGMELTKAGDYADVEAAFRASLELYRNFYPSSVGLWRELRRQGRTNEAVLCHQALLAGLLGPSGCGFDLFNRLAGLPEKVYVESPRQTERTAVILCIGQSNGANHGKKMYKSEHGDKILNYYMGKYCIAESPMLGSSGLDGDPWTNLGNMMISMGYADRVIFVPAAVGATSIRRWQEGGDLNYMMQSVIAESQANLTITHILWHQGESDFVEKTSGEDYKTGLSSVIKTIRSNNVGAPIYICVASKVIGADGWHPDNPIATAQRLIVDNAEKIYSGVDTDLILDEMGRYDGVHFSELGQDKFARAWIKILMQ